MDDYRLERLAVKARQPNWKQKLRENCLKRVKEDRTRLLWKMRIPGDANLEEKENIEATLRDIISDEFEQIKGSSMITTSPSKEDDTLWIYDGVHTASQSNEVECEDIMIELQRIFYEDLRAKQKRRDGMSLWVNWAKVNLFRCKHFWSATVPSKYPWIKGISSRDEASKFILYLVGDGRSTRSCLDPWHHSKQEDYDGIWEEQLDDLLALAAFEHLQLNGDQVCKETLWCPICKQGELLQNHHFIYCTLCTCQIDRGNEANLDILRLRLCEVHSEHLERGCKLAPKFCMETRFNLTALYIKCEACSTFEIVL